MRFHEETIKAPSSWCLPEGPTAVPLGGDNDTLAPIRLEAHLLLPRAGPPGVRNEGRPQVWSMWAFCALATEKEHVDVSLVTCCLGSNLETGVRCSTGYMGNSLERDSSVIVR